MTNDTHKTCRRCKEILPLHNFHLFNTGYYSSNCRPCSVGRTKKWKEENKDKFEKQYEQYFCGERGFVISSIGRRFKPSEIDRDLKDVTYKHLSFRRKVWVPEMTKQEMWAELFLHIQYMKDRHPESDGRLCRLCEQPWTYNRFVKKTRQSIWTNFSIDRFDTTQTYKKGNIIFLCRKCNSVKNASEIWMWRRLLEIKEELEKDKGTDIPKLWRDDDKS